MSACSDKQVVLESDKSASWCWKLRISHVVSYSLDLSGLADTIGWAACVCILLFAHTDQAGLVSEFPTGGRASEGSLCLNHNSPGFLIPLHVWFQFQTGMTITHHHGDLAASLLAKILGARKIIDIIKTHSAELKGRKIHLHRGSQCAREAHSTEICLCSPGPGALIPDWADRDKNQLSLPHSTSHPRGRSPL